MGDLSFLRGTGVVYLSVCYVKFEVQEYVYAKKTKNLFSDFRKIA